MKKFWFIAVLISAPAFAQEADIPVPRPRPDAEDRIETGPELPLPRPGNALEWETVAPEDADDESDITAPESDEAAPDQGGAASNDEAATEETPVRAAPQKPAKPARVYQSACPAVLMGRVEATILPPIADDPCKIQSPFSVTALNFNGQEVALSAPVATNCQMATQFASWIERVDAYAVSVLDAQIAKVLTGTSYMCRPRNNASGADVSEHGFANALDIVGFELTDGRRITLPDDWGDDDFAGRTMRFAHDAACGHFTTVLGPEANALHEDHFHLDLGCHGKTCTARICE